jgi:hypothetical protein
VVGDAAERADRVVELGVAAQVGAGQHLGADQAGKRRLAVQPARRAQAGAHGGEVPRVGEQVQRDARRLARVGRAQRHAAPAI